MSLSTPQAQFTQPIGISHPLTFNCLHNWLPQELINQILKAWIGEQHVVVDGDLCVSYACDTDRVAALPAVLPNSLYEEYTRQRQLAWLRDTKAFRSPSTFYMSHYLLSLDAHSNLRPFDDVPNSLIQEIEEYLSTPMLKIPRHPTMPFPNHGLEKIILDFDANQYFTLFNVTVPPFHWPALHDDLRTDPHLRGAASFLQHTEELTLHFGDAYKWCNPWYNILDLVYWQDARYRKHVCDSGVVIDWILEYAWHGESLQHIPSLQLTGDIQPWVLRKWNDIFFRQRLMPEDELDPFVAHKPDIRAIESLGMNPAPGAVWLHEDHFPPVCKCEIGCWRLFKGGVADVGGDDDAGWDESKPGPTLPVGGWDVESIEAHAKTLEGVIW